ncbi:MAG: cytochrome P450 [Sciscionella sp.]
MTAILPRSRASAARLPPGPKTPTLLQSVRFGTHRLEFLAQCRARFGDIFTLSLLGGTPVVVLADPAQIKAVFGADVHTMHAGEANEILRPIMGPQSLLTLDEDAHLRARKLLMPAFNGAALRGYSSMMSRIAAEAAERLPVGTPFAAHRAMQSLTLDIILQVVFGIRQSPQLDSFRTLVRTLTDASIFIMLGSTVRRLHSVPPWRKFWRIMHRIDEVLFAEIAERRAASDLAERTDVLSRMLQAGSTSGHPAERMSDAELRDELITLLLAGHETTATALAWAIHELSRDQPELDRAIAAADRGDGRYLEAAFTESLRLRPVIAQVGRRLTEEVSIAGYRLAPGTVLAPSISLVQADAEHYPEPDAFRAARFLDAAPPSNIFLPFGGGARRCIGAGFAQAEGAAVLRELLTRYELTAPAPEPEPTKGRNITNVAGRGAQVILRRRARP